jgi:hypothetical protein
MVAGARKSPRTPRVVIEIRLPDRRLTADLAAKSLRRALATIGEHGPHGVAAIVQGKLVGDTITARGRHRRAPEGAASGRRRRRPQHERTGFAR